jgi:hypothetical protein
VFARYYNFFVDSLFRCAKVWILKLEGRMDLPETHKNAQFKMGDYVQKKSGSQWHGRIVGWYSTGLTPIGWCVESVFEQGSVQIYPEKALRKFLPN